MEIFGVKWDFKKSYRSHKHKWIVAMKYDENGKRVGAVSLNLKEFKMCNNYNYVLERRRSKSSADKLARHCNMMMDRGLTERKKINLTPPSRNTREY